MAVTTNFQTAVLDLVDDLVNAELVNLNNVQYKKAFEVSKLATQFRVVPGIREGQVIPIMSNSPDYAKFPYKDPSSCTIPACDVDMPFEAKGWEIGQIACKTSICVSSFDENFLYFWNEYKRLFNDNNLNGALLQFILRTFERDLEAAMWRVGFFGDRTTSSLDPNYALLRPINGIFTQAEAGNGLNITISQNSGTTPMTGEEAYEILLEAYEYAATQPWFDPANMQFTVTAAFASVLIGWYNSLGDKSMYNCECFSADGVSATRNWNLDGVTKVFGIPVVAYRELDGVINQLGLGRRYRAILTTKDNIILGTSEMDQLPNFDMWYSKDDDLIYLKGGASIAASLVTDDYVYLGAETNSTPSS